MIEIKSRHGTILVSGEFVGLKEAIQEAVKKGANLRGANLEGANLEGAKIRDEITVTQAPIQLLGLTWLITIWDAHMQIGCKFHSHVEWQGFDDKKWLRMGGKDALRLKQEHLNTLMALCESHATKAQGRAA